ncbi:MAG TPA: hypothetical protein VFW40_12365 [Capsulimonadaceae bacterium]|nr:hypothetical protein [Capsulimonadaceae bacterium]
MPGQKQLCLVEDVVTVIGRGIIVKTDGFKPGLIRGQDWIEIRCGDGSRHVARVRSIEPLRGSGSPGLMLTSVTREDIQTGDEVWSVAVPPAQEPPDVFFRSAKPTRQLPEVLTPDFWRRLVTRR